MARLWEEVGKNDNGSGMGHRVDGKAYMRVASLGRELRL